jgi:dihydrofolate synthase/folylpolyglutamate synthase
LAKTLGQINGGKWNIICGALNTRDPAEFLATLAALAGSVCCLAIADQPASLSATEMTDAALAQGLDAAPATNILSAFDQLDPAYPVIICGSLYLAGHVLEQNKTLPD